MSDLQIGLLILGAFIVTGVVAFNWWQERQFRRRAELGVRRPDVDILLEAGAGASGRGREQPRIEPQFEAHQSASRQPAVAGTGNERPGAAPDSAIDYIAELRAGEVIPAPAIKALETAFAAVGRRVKLSGYDYHARTWEPVTEPDHWYTSLRLSLQLVDRDGPVTQEQLNTVASLTREHAQRISAIAELPEIEVALQKAAELDEFCSDVDVIVGINVIAQTGQLFNGTQIKAIAEANGMQLQSRGVFVCHDEDGKLLFTLDNQDSRPFRAEHLRQLTTPGITFLLDVPRTLDGLKVFDRLVATSTQFAKSLDGMLADDNRVALNDVGLDKIRNQLRAIYSKMEHRGIPAGSAAAQRLFS